MVPLLIGGLLLLAMPIIRSAKAQEPFITTWETTSADESITIPTNGVGVSDYDFAIDWGDGTTETYSGNDPDPSHTYSSAGSYSVEITETFPRIFLNAGFNEDGDEENAKKLMSIDHWGSIEWETMFAAFSGAANMTYNTSDKPNLTKVSSMREMFKDAEKFNGDIGGWDVSNVENMLQMFASAGSFNRDIGDWDVSKVNTMKIMFNQADSFNKDISGWDVSGVSDMESMFLGADSFGQDIGDWDVSNVENMTNMFSFAGLSPTNYDATLIGWSRLNLKSIVYFHAGESQYTVSAESARESIIDSGWSIQDEGKTPVVNVSITGSPDYTPPPATPGTDNNLIGRFSTETNDDIQSVDVLPFINDLTITFDGSNQGVESVEVWQSDDDLFDSQEDSLLSTKNMDPASQIPNEMTFANIDDPSFKQTPQYLFVTVDLTEEGGGEVEATLNDSLDLTIPGGDLTNESSEFPVALSSGKTALPVELTAFDVAVQNRKAILRWQTASESQNAGFYIERKEGSNSTNAAWKKVGFQKSNATGGSTTEPQRYRFTDKDLPYENDKLLYRLRQVDTDGTVIYSGIRSVEIGPPDDLRLYKPFPNPAKESATLHYTLPKAMDVSIRVYDVMGREVSKLQYGTKGAGRNKIQISTLSLSAGIYFVRIQADGKVQTKKFTVMK